VQRTIKRIVAGSQRTENECDRICVACMAAWAERRLQKYFFFSDVCSSIELAIRINWPRDLDSVNGLSNTLETCSASAEIDQFGLRRWCYASLQAWYAGMVVFRRLDIRLGFDLQPELSPAGAGSSPSPSPSSPTKSSYSRPSVHYGQILCHPIVNASFKQYVKLALLLYRF
jgi:hypothetical protein